MKRVMFFTLLAAFFAAGCSKSDIISGTSSTTPSTDTDVFNTDEDYIANTEFDRTISIVWTNSSATVSGDANGVVSVSGTDVTVNNTTTSEKVKYQLSGSCSNGSLKLYSNNKQALVLSSLTLTSTSGAAINNQGKKRCFVVLDGSSTLADGSSAAYSTSSSEDLKAVIFSEGQLIFSGSGNLTVNANNAQDKSAIVSDDYVRFLANASVTASAGSGAGHGVKGNEYVQISDGTLSITTNANMKKGITADDYVLVEGGTTNIKVTGGVAYDSEDSEYTGTAGIKADNYFAMTGGTVTINNTGTGGKGISAGNYSYYSSNGNSLTDSYISGGSLTITTSGSESNDVSSKAIKIGFKQRSGYSYIYAGNLLVSGGATSCTCSKSEAVEVKGKLTVSGGSFYAYSTGDDAINSQGEMNITGGYVYGYSSANDAIDTNCDMKLSGGYVYAITTKGSPEVALDANTEGGYSLYIYSNATVVAYGGLERGYSSANSVYTLSGTANAWNALYDGSSYIAAFKAR